MLFAHKLLVILLTSSSLCVYDMQSTSKKVLTYPKELFIHNEIVDEVKFRDFTTHFITQEKIILDKAIIIVSRPFVFVGDSSLKEAFFNALPIKANDVAIVSLRVKDKEMLHAMNKKIYEVLISVFGKCNIPVSAVVPATVFKHQPITQDIGIDDIKEFLKEKKVISTANFLLRTPSPVASHQAVVEDDTESHADKKNIHKQVIMLVVSFIFFGISLFYVLWSGTISNPWFGHTQKPNPVKSSVVNSTGLTPTATPTTPLFDKSKITIEVLNGSGVEGQAGKIAAILKENGYENTTTDNAPDIASSSSLFYNTKVPKAEIEKIMTLLKLDVSSSRSGESSQSGKFDVTITTGKDSSLK